MRFLSAFLLFTLVSQLSAEAAVASHTKKKKAPKAAAAPVMAEPVSAPAEAESGSGTIEGYLQSLSTIPDVMNRRDPFIAAPTPFEARPELTDLDDNPSAPVLERYPIQKYEVVATLLGDQYPRALVRLPDSEKGKVLIVREKDKLGNRGGVIRKILKDGIAVVQAQRSSLGFIDKVETVIRVGVSDRKNVAVNRQEDIQPGSKVAPPANAIRDSAPAQVPGGVGAAPAGVPAGMPSGLPSITNSLPSSNQEDKQ